MCVYHDHTQGQMLLLHQTNPPPLPPVKISYSYIAEELNFWESSIVCYILGANPPLHVVEGFVKRIWNPAEIDKIGTVAKGFYLIRMKSKESMAAACESNGILFDKKTFYR